MVIVGWKYNFKKHAEATSFQAALLRRKEKMCCFSGFAELVMGAKKVTKPRQPVSDNIIARVVMAAWLLPVSILEAIFLNWFAGNWNCYHRLRLHPLQGLHFQVKM